MATNLDLEIDQGSKVAVNITAKNPDDSIIDLTGYTVRSQIRKSYKSTTFYSPTVDIITPASGLIQWVLDSDTSINMPSGGYVYDVFVENAGGEDFRVLEGVLVLRPAATKPV